VELVASTIKMLELLIVDFVKFESWTVALFIEDHKSIIEFVKFEFVAIELCSSELLRIVLFSDEFCIKDIITKVFCRLE